MSKMAFEDSDCTTQPTPLDVYRSWSNNPRITNVRAASNAATLTNKPRSANVIVKKEVNGNPRRSNLIRLCADGMCRIESQALSILHDLPVEDLVNRVNFGQSEWVILTSNTPKKKLVIHFERKSLRQAMRELGYMDKK